MSVDISDLPPALELIPGRIPEIDEHTRIALAGLILDESIQLPPRPSGNLRMYHRLADQEFIKLFKPLVEVLQLNPSQDPPPAREHIRRASNLGLVPSDTTVYRRPMNMSALQTGLGFRAKYRFNDWMLSDYISSGQRLARHVGGRPTRNVVTAAGRGEYRALRGDFPTVDDIKSRFGKLSVYHELIGYPSCKGWIVDDYIDWACAFYRQNPGRELSARVIDGFSAKGRGPSKRPIIKTFDSVAKFKYISQKEFEDVREIETQDRQLRLTHAEELARYDAMLVDALAESNGEESRQLQITAQYRIALGLGISVAPTGLRDAARLKSPAGFVRWCMSRSNGKVSAASVETQASALGVFDDLWPMYRFQNVDLTLPKAA